MNQFAVPEDFQYNWKRLEGRWKSVCSRFRKEHPTLTEEDVDYSDGEFDLMTQNIALRLGRSRESVCDEINRMALDDPETKIQDDRSESYS